MARITINRSVSFDPVLFDKMESRRASLMMDRSDYVKRCIIKDMLSGGSMTIDELPKELAESLLSVTNRSGTRPSDGKKKPKK